MQGGDAVADTVHTYQELIERFGSSLPLLNGLGGAYMILGRFAEAEKRLIDAIGMVRACVHVCVCEGGGLCGCGWVSAYVRVGCAMEWDVVVRAVSACVCFPRACSSTVCL